MEHDIFVLVILPEQMIKHRTEVHICLFFNLQINSINV